MFSSQHQNALRKHQDCRADFGSIAVDLFLYQLLEHRRAQSIIRHITKRGDDRQACAVLASGPVLKIGFADLRFMGTMSGRE